jgi:hypothetical protein
MTQHGAARSGGGTVGARHRQGANEDDRRDQWH